MTDQSKFKEIPKEGTTVVDTFDSRDIDGDRLNGVRMVGAVVQERPETYVVQTYGYAPASKDIPLRIVLEELVEPEPMSSLEALRTAAGIYDGLDVSGLGAFVERVEKVVAEMRAWTEKRRDIGYPAHEREQGDLWADRLEGKP